MIPVFPMLILYILSERQGDHARLGWATLILFDIWETIWEVHQDTMMASHDIHMDRIPTVAASLVFSVVVVVFWKLSVINDKVVGETNIT